MTRGLREDTDVLVIGGGILGCAAAHYLASDGIDVTLVERARLNGEASGTNAGSLHFQLLRQIDYSSERLERLRPAARLHAAAAELWQRLEDELGCDLEVRLAGGVMVAETEQQLADLELKSRIENAMGIGTRILSAAELRALSPCLSDDLVGGSFCHHEGVANPLLVTPAFVQSAQRRGARFLEHREVTEIVRGRAGEFHVKAGNMRITARRIVNAAGTEMGRLTQQIGVHLPVTSNTFQMHVTEPVADVLAPLVMHGGRRLSLKQVKQGNFIIGGGWPGNSACNGHPAAVSHDSVAGNTWVAARVVPLISQLRLLRTWTGVVPNTPERVPIIGEVTPGSGFFAVHTTAGFALAPVVGRLVAELVGGRPTTLAVHSYSPGLFAGRDCPDYRVPNPGRE